MNVEAYERNPVSYRAGVADVADERARVVALLDGIERRILQQAGEVSSADYQWRARVVVAFSEARDAYRSASVSASPGVSP
jgi:hypothetical protein